MSRQIAALEADLDTPLFQRRHRALALTDAGRRLLAACTPVLAQLREAMATIRAPQSRVVLSLTTTPSFAALWLIPRLAGSTREHPGVDVRIDASFERRDLVRDGFHLVVRYGPAAGAAGQRLFSEAIVPVCSPALRRQAGAPLDAPADLVHHTLLEMSTSQPGGMPLEWGSWLQALGLPQVQPRSKLTFNSYNETIAAAVAGQGIALGRRPLIDALLRKRQLVVPFGDVTDTERVYSLVLSPAARSRPAALDMARWLVAAAGGSA